MLLAQLAQASSLWPIWAQTERWHGGRWYVCGVWSSPWDKPLQNRRHRQRLQFGTKEVLLGMSRAGNGEGGMLSWIPPQSSHSLHLSFGWIKMGGRGGGLQPLPRTERGGEVAALLPATCP